MPSNDITTSTAADEVLAEACCVLDEAAATVAEEAQQAVDAACCVLEQEMDAVLDDATIAAGRASDLLLSRVGSWAAVEALGYEAYEKAWASAVADWKAAYERVHGVEFSGCVC